MRLIRKEVEEEPKLKQLPKRKYHNYRTGPAWDEYREQMKERARILKNEWSARCRAARPEYAKDHWKKYQKPPLSGTISFSCINCRKEFSGPIQKHGVLKSALRNHYEYCIDREARDKKVQERIAAYSVPKETIERGRKQHRIKIKQREAFINDVKVMNGCACCGYMEKATKLLFHHPYGRDSEKRMVSYLKKMRAEEMVAEMRRCVVICFKCHRTTHADLVKGKVTILCTAAVPDYSLT